jgi:hypothetical protein
MKSRKIVFDKQEKYSFICGIKDDKSIKYKFDDWGYYINCDYCNDRLRTEFIPSEDKDTIKRLYYPADEYYRCTVHDTVSFYCNGCVLLEKNNNILCINCWKK